MIATDLPSGTMSIRHSTSRFDASISLVTLMEGLDGLRLLQATNDRMPFTSMS
jgi:hypothetical protein